MHKAHGDTKKIYYVHKADSVSDNPHTPVHTCGYVYVLHDLIELALN